LSQAASLTIFPIEIVWKWLSLGWRFSRFVLKVVLRPGAEFVWRDQV
jgi:hypothetical protein